VRACVPEKIFRGLCPRPPGDGRGEEGEGREGKGTKGRKRTEEGKGGKGGEGIRVGREGIGPPQCLTQIDAPAWNFGFFVSWNFEIWSGRPELS
jgi:hypothetical protein